MEIPLFQLIIAFSQLQMTKIFCAELNAMMDVPLPGNEEVNPGGKLIAMIKKSSKIKSGYQDKNLNIKEIYSRNKKRRGRSRYRHMGY